MSPKLPPVSPSALIAILERNGFGFVSQRGSHAKYRDARGRTTIVPIHKGEDIGPGLFLRILREAGIDPSEFR